MHRTGTRVAAGVAGACTALLAAVAAAPSAAAAPATGLWATDGHDAGNTYANPSETSITPATIGKLQQQYRITPAAGDGCLASRAPVVADGKVFTVDGTGQDGGVGAYATGSGKRVWRQSLQLDNRDSFGTTAMAYQDGLLFLTGDSCDSASDPNGYLRAYDADTGKLLWSKDGISRPYDTLTVTGHLVIASGTSEGGDAGTYAFDAATGKSVWTRAGLVSPHGTLTGGTLVLVDRDASRTEAVDATTGSTKWRSTHRILAEAAVPGGARFVASVDGTDTASVSVADGSIGWSVPTPATQRVAVSGDRVYLAEGPTQQNRVVALDLSDGSTAWTRSYPANTVYDGQVTVAGGVVYVPSNKPSGKDAKVLALRADTGAPLGMLATTGHGFVQHAVVAGGRAYVTDDRSVVAYHLP